MKKEKMIQCNRNKCGSTENLIKMSSRISRKTGEKIQYYHCRKCNTERLKEYRNTPKGKENIFNSVYRSMKKYSVKQNARVLLAYHIRKGNVSKPSVCTICNKECKPHGHHEDYTKPLEVLWVCRSCHSDIHRLLRQG